jgi:hypothetical protein
MLEKSSKFFVEKYFYIAPTKQSAMERMIRSVRVSVPNSYRKKYDIQKLELDFKKEIVRLRQYFILNSIFYSILYANIVFFVFSYHRYVKEIIGIISSLVSALGAPLFIVLIFFVHYTIGVIYQKLNMIATRLVVLYEEVRNLNTSNNKNKRREI